VQMAEHHGLSCPRLIGHNKNRQHIVWRYWPMWLESNGLQYGNFLRSSGSECDALFNETHGGRKSVRVPYYATAPVFRSDSHRTQRRHATQYPASQRAARSSARSCRFCGSFLQSRKISGF
jgi:hypothetical protein